MRQYGHQRSRCVKRGATGGPKRTLDESFALVLEIVTEYGGTVEKYIGDAVFALFGAPTTHSDDPVRALRAAEACRDRLAGGPVAVRIGVETGEALIDL